MQPVWSVNVQHLTKSGTVSDYELNWSYTVRCTKESSDWRATKPSLLKRLHKITIPQLPLSMSLITHCQNAGRWRRHHFTIWWHGYRIPLMFTVKYQWENHFSHSIFAESTPFGSGWRWIVPFKFIKILSCLFLKARAKKGVVGWRRDVKFDRLLTRFKEYDKDVLKKTVR